VVGGVSQFYGALDMIMVVNYMQFVNINYPKNLQNFFRSFDYANLEFIGSKTKSFGSDKNS
jgi:hypothetical protein